MLKKRLNFELINLFLIKLICWRICHSSDFFRVGNMHAVKIGKQFGLSVIELLMVVTLIGLVSSYAIPSFSSLVVTNKISSVTSEFHAALLLTRSEAIKRGRNVTICRSSNADSTAPSCATVNSNPLTNSGWGEGWLIYVDIDGSNTYSPGDVLIRAQGALFQNAAAGAVLPVPNRNRITFNATGQTFGAFMRFSINRPDFDNNATHDRYICIASGGRARVDTFLCSGD
jgi:type IV fimbrial biogenesis protein FimT